MLLQVRAELSPSIVAGHNGAEATRHGIGAVSAIDWRRIAESVRRGRVRRTNFPVLGKNGVVSRLCQDIGHVGCGCQLRCADGSERHRRNCAVRNIGGQRLLEFVIGNDVFIGLLQHLAEEVEGATLGKGHFVWQAVVSLHSLRKPTPHFRDNRSRYTHERWHTSRYVVVVRDGVIHLNVSGDLHRHDVHSGDNDDVREHLHQVLARVETCLHRQDQEASRCEKHQEAVEARGASIRYHQELDGQQDVVDDRAVTRDIECPHAAVGRRECSGRGQGRHQQCESKQ